MSPMARPWLPSLLFLVLATAALADASLGAQAARGRTMAEQVAAVLDEVRRTADASRGANQLARLGEGAVEPLLARLGNGEESVARRAAILGALAQMPAEGVLEFLAELARGTPPEAERRAGLDLLARFGSGADLPLAFALGGPTEADAPPGPELRKALEAALAGILAREPGAARTLTDSFERVSAAARDSIIAVLARSGGGAATALADLLGRAGGEADGLILLELGGVGRGRLPEFDPHVSERMRPYLVHSDPGLVSLAVMACTTLADDTAVPDLVVLLEDPRKNVCRATHQALLTLTGTNLTADADEWLAWLDEGLVWWNERSDPCRAAIVSGTPAEAAAALQEAARQRLFVRELVPLLQLGVRRSEPDLAKNACRALAALPRRVARDALLELTELPELELAELARTYLNQIRDERPGAARRPTLPQLKPMP